MSITFKSEADIILWTLARLLVNFTERQYLFAAQCIWWIAALDSLDPALRQLLDHRKFPDISSIPRDIHRQSETDEDEVPVQNEYQADPLRHTRKERVNCLPKTRKQLMAKKEAVVAS